MIIVRKKEEACWSNVELELIRLSHILTARDRYIRLPKVLKKRETDTERRRGIKSADMYLMDGLSCSAITYCFDLLNHLCYAVVCVSFVSGRSMHPLFVSVLFVALLTVDVIAPCCECCLMTVWPALFEWGSWRVDSVLS